MRGSVGERSKGKNDPRVSDAETSVNPGLEKVRGITVSNFSKGLEGNGFRATRIWSKGWTRGFVMVEERGSTSLSRSAMQ